MKGLTAMLEPSPKPVESLDDVARRTTTRFDLDKVDDTLHAVQVVTKFDRETRRFLSYAERIVLSQPEPGVLVIRHDPDRYVTIGFYSCHRYSAKALSEAHHDAVETLRYHRDNGGEVRVNALFN